ncbi:ketopantoate reductase family protein [Variovorax sp. Sphag1AA]|uniref:ketopantoate reductase family protein n=1 Tax=Variovorax sp. Sphag1AA TaxID=2587027 RepID=UPI00160AF7A3|nr:2-dehydropantoate 2-reductase [Variovorax sp. Sphag1AA]MBB3178734.1 2-dehydropantoate 2-reductase [Variovorax sp. Sphag1AA]
MKIAIMGAGGLGGYFGARLAAGGEDVAFIARGSHLAAMRQDGLRVSSALGDLHLKDVKATDTPADIGPVDIVLMSVKLWDTESAVQSLKPLLGPGTAVVSFQNGVGKDDLLTRTLGAEAVMGGVCYIAAVIGEPGEIVHTGTMQKLVFGELDGQRSERAERFLAACVRAGIDAQISDDIRRLTWEKFVFLVGLSGTTASIRQPIGPIRSNRTTRAFLRQVIAETVAVGRAQGVTFADNFVDGRLGFCDTLPAEMTSSMHGDLKRCKPLELPWLSGAVADMGQAAGVPTPANSAIRDILALYVNGDLQS